MGRHEVTYERSPSTVVEAPNKSRNLRMILTIYRILTQTHEHLVAHLKSVHLPHAARYNELLGHKAVKMKERPLPKKGLLRRSRKSLRREVDDYELRAAL